MLDLLQEQRCIWQRLQEEKRPVVLYGMGDGGDKLLAACERFAIPVWGVFASDGFVRGHSFRGFPVQSLAQVEAQLDDFIVLLAFATQRPEVIETIGRVAQRHTLLAPDLPVCGGELFTWDYLLEHRTEATEAYGLMADSRSRQVYLDVLNFKLSGNIAYLKRCCSPKSEIYQTFFTLGNDEIFVDAGAYTGDTVEEFLQQTAGQYREIVALEPDRRNYKRLLKTTERLGLERICCLNAGVWDAPGTLAFAHKSGRQAALQEQGGTPTQVISIDGVRKGAPVSYIKYDVEGAEEQALVGSGKTIGTCAPKLLVSAYHRSNDLFRLPQLIHSLHSGYRIYLRHHPYIPAWDVNLYAVDNDMKRE